MEKSSDTAMVELKQVIKGLARHVKARDEEEEIKNELELLKKMEKQEEESKEQTWKQKAICEVKKIAGGVLIGVVLTTAVVLYFRAPEEVKAIPAKSPLKQMLLELLLEKE
jgi:thiamine pyrophosphate-dependent acetolactate synthase large subunit-like protein